jgi:hypothetical protein
MSALLSVSLFFVGCEKEVEVEKWRDPAREILVPEVVATTPAQLTEYLAPASGYLVVGTSGTFQLSADTVVPTDKTLIVQSGTFSTNSKKLTVKGKVYVNYDTTLTASDGNGAIVADGGSVTVLIGGNLNVASAASVVDTAGTLVSINGGTLTVASLASTAIGTTLGYITKGELVVTALSNASSVMPSDITKIAGISKDKRLTVAAGKAETVATLTIPAGLDLTAFGGDTFQNITTLTVNGKLTADAAATLAAATKIDVGNGGTLVIPGAAVAVASAGVDIEVGNGGTLTAAGATNEWAKVKTLTIKDGAKVDLGGIAAIFADLESLSIGDDSNVVLGTATGTTVTFKSTGLTKFEIGKSSLTVGEATTGAKVNVNVAITQDATIKGITILKGKKVEVTGATLTVGATGITLQADASAAQLILKGGAKPAMLITGGADATLGVTGDITLTGAVEFVATGAATTFQVSGAANVTTAKGVLGLTSSGVAFKSIKAGAANQDFTFKAGASQAGSIIATSTLASES